MPTTSRTTSTMITATSTTSRSRPWLETLPPPGRRGPIRGTRSVGGPSRVSGSSKKSNSKSVSRSVIRREPPVNLAAPSAAPEEFPDGRPKHGAMAEAAAVSTSALVLGRYRPLRPLGSGGSGSVWLARDERHGLDVALKIIAKEGRAAPRAEREATAAARLRHPHCLRAYGLEADDKHLYIPYEYVPGSTLRQALRAGELNDEGAVEASAQILEGLAFAHARGIVHRDVKPSNVLVA